MYRGTGGGALNLQALNQKAMKEPGGRGLSERQIYR